MPADFTTFQDSPLSVLGSIQAGFMYAERG